MHEPDVAPREPVDRLPVVPYQEVGRVSGAREPQGAPSSLRICPGTRLPVRTGTSASIYPGGYDLQRG